MTKARDIANLGDSLINDADDNVALGDGALDSQTTGANNVAIGESALAANTTGSFNVSVGRNSLKSNTTAQFNTSVGHNALQAATTSGYNTAVGTSSLFWNTGASNVGIGYASLNSNTTGGTNTAVGTDSLRSNTTASDNTAVGYQSGYSNTTGGANISVGRGAGFSTTTGNNNTAMGYLSLANNTTAGNNTAVGYQSLYSHVNSDANSQNTALGFKAGFAATGFTNTFIGGSAGVSATTGNNNTFIGYNAGGDVTTGGKNTILGKYNGNQGSLDIRTSSNNIVLSDGDGNPRIVARNGYYSNGSVYLGSYFGSGLYDDPGFNDQYGITFRALSGTSPAMMICTDARHYFYKVTAGGVMDFAYKATIGATPSTVGGISITSSATSYNTSSDHRLKENVVELTDATDRLKQLEPKRFNFIADADTTVDGFLAHEVQSVVPEAITGTHNEVDDDGNPVYQGIDQSKLVPLLVATIKELEARITALEAN